MTAGSDAIAAIARRRTQSLSAIVRDELERMILNDELKAGERLNEQHLAQRLGVSRGPVREATRALERAGLLTAIVNQGVFVREIGVEEVRELYDMRAVVFGWACFCLAPRIEPGQVAVLRALVAQMTDVIETGEAAAYYPINLAFHDRIMDFAGHRRAAQIYQSVVKEAHLFRRRSLLKAPAMRESNAEHAAMVATLEAGDALGARAAAEAHHFGGKRRWLATLPGQEGEEQRS